MDFYISCESIKRNPYILKFVPFLTEKVEELVRQALLQKKTPKEILDDGLLSAMKVVGEDFKNRVIFLPDVLLAARAMNAGMKILKPLLEGAEGAGEGKVVLGTVQGDLHDIGKNLVAIMLKGGGFDVIDLGSDVAPELFVETAKKEGAQVIGMSALLTTTMTVMKKVTQLVKEEGLAVKTIAGGAPLSQDIIHQFGVDAYSYDASNAVETIKALIQGE